jgi:hypothetical protein
MNWQLFLLAAGVLSLIPVSLVNPSFAHLAVFAPLYPLIQCFYVDWTGVVTAMFANAEARLQTIWFMNTLNISWLGLVLSVVTTSFVSSGKKWLFSLWFLLVSIQVYTLCTLLPSPNNIHWVVGRLIHPTLQPFGLYHSFFDRMPYYE